MFTQYLFKTSACLALVFFLCIPALASNNEDYEQAIASFADKKYKDAYIQVRNALQAEPDYLPAQILLAKLYQVNGLYTQANEAFEQAYQAGGDGILLFAPWGKVLLRLKESDRILALEFENKLSGEALIDWYVVRAQACMQQQRVLCAKQQYEQILDLEATHPLGINGLALIALESNNVDEAETYISQSFEQDPELAQTWWIKGKIAKERGDFEAAQRDYNRAFLLAPDNPIMARSLIDAYVASSNFDAALLITEDLLLQTDDDLYVLFVNSWLTSQVASLNVIKPQLEQIATRLANVQEEALLAEPALFYLRGMVALMQRNFETARENFISFAKLADTDTQTAILLASTNIALDDKKSAMLALQPHENALIEDNVDQALLLGSLYLENQQRFRAVDLLESLEQAYPKNINVALFSIRVSLSRGRFKEGDEQLTLLLKNNPQNRQVLLAYALHHLNQGRADLAAEAIETLVVQYPEDMAIQNMLAARLIIDKQYAEAQRILNHVLAQSPELFAAQYNQATLHIHRGETLKAQTILVKLSALRPDHLQVAYQLAKIDFQLGNIQSAISGYQRILLTNGAQANITFAAVAAYAQLGDNQSAIDLLRKLLAREPGNEVALVQLSSFYIKVKENTKALTTLQKLDVLPQLAIKTKMAQAELWMALGDKEKALDAMKSAHEAAPLDINIHLHWVKLMLASGAYSSADKELQYLHERYPEAPFVYFKMGELAQSQGNLSQAYTHFLSALKYNPNLDLALAKLYAISVQQGNFEQLVTLLDEVVNNNPERYFPRNLLAQYHFYYGDSTQAIHHYTYLLDNVNEVSRFAMLNRLAMLYFNNNPVKSKDYAQQAYELAPHDAEVLHTYGWSLSLNGQYEDSLPLLREASVRNAVDLTLRYRLAFTLSQLGNNDEAKQILSALLNSPVEFGQRSKAIKLLNELTL